MVKPRTKTAGPITTPTRSRTPAPASQNDNSVAAPAADGQAISALELRKKELIEEVVLRSGVKRKEVKPAIEAMLAVLGETIEAERPINLEPLGKMRLNRSKDTPNGRIHICKLRRKHPSAEKEPEAEKTPASPLAKTDPGR